jgi:hypothetical protein
MTSIPAGGAMSAAREEPGGRTVLVYFLILAAVKGALKTAGYARTRRGVERLVSRVALLAAGDATLSALVSREAEAVARAAAFYPGRALCLEQSLALYLRLRRAGVAATFHLGVQPHPFAAHAWVSVSGQPVNERGEIVRQLLQLPEPPARRGGASGR